MNGFFGGLTQIFPSNERRAFDELQGLLCKDYISDLQDKYIDQYQLIISQIEQDIQKNKIPNACAATCGKIRAILKNYNVKT